MIPRLILGTSSMGSVIPLGPPDRNALRFLDEIFELGVRAFDLAASYQVGGTERLFGAWIRARRNRDSIFVITKGAHPIPILAPRRLTVRSLEDDLHASLERLRVNDVDLYLVHKDDEAAALEPIVEALARFRKQGKIRAWGVSNFSVARLSKIDALARDAGEKIAASSTHFSLFAWSRGAPYPGSVSAAGDRDARAFHESHELPLLAWSPLGAGFAAGHATRTYDNEKNRARRARAGTLAKTRGVAPAQIALAYVLSQPFPTSAIVATKSAHRMKENLGALDVKLTRDEIDALEK